MRIAEELIDTSSFWSEAFDVLGLELVDHGEHVTGVPVEDGEDRAVTYGAV